MFIRLFAVLSAAALTACASSHSIPLFIPQNVQGGAQAIGESSVTATFVIAVPTQALGAKSVSISANGGAPVIHDIGNKVSGCTPAHGSQPLTCSVPVTAKTGTNTFVLKTYTQPGGGGSVIASANILEVLKGNANVLITLAATPASIFMALLPASPRQCNAATKIPLFIAVEDAAGEIIVTSSYGLTITLADSDKSGTTSLSTTTVTQSGTAVTLAYDGDLLKSATISATAPGISPSNIHNAVLKPAQMNYVLDLASHAIDVFPTTANGNVAPTRRLVLNGPDNGSNEDGLISNCTIFVSDSGSTLIAIFSYDGRKNGTISPLTEITGNQTGLLASGVAVSPITGMVYAPIQQSSTPGIGIWPANANGNVPPTSTIIGSNTMIGNPSSLAFDSSGKVYLLAYRNVLVFAKGATGNVAPVQNLSTGLPCPDAIAVDAGDQMYVSDNCAATVSVWPKGATGSQPASRVITLPSGGGANGVGVDYANNSYTADTYLATVYSFSPTANGKVAPRTTISGSNTTLLEPNDVSL
jgi:hypothetical protein